MPTRDAAGTMKAAVLHQCGQAPRFDSFDDPVAGPGQVVLDVLAAGVNHLDLARAAGQAYDVPPVPSVVGSDGVGRTHDDRRVYFHKTVAPYGSCGERTLVDEAELIDVPAGVDDAVAAALGNAGLAALLALEWRARLAPGERVLVLGATGAVGMLAVQLARRMGAGRVVVTGRDTARLARLCELGAAGAVDTPGLDLEPASLQEAAGGPIDVIVDLLWGPSAIAAVHAAASGARLVQVGSLAGAAAAIPAPVVRAKQLSILGLAGLATPLLVRAPAYARLVQYAADGDLVVDLERVPLARAAEAWDRQRRTAHRKLVITPLVAGG